nr:MAG TPA: hypothetical protein [Caudoviricetes sp.]
MTHWVFGVSGGMTLADGLSVLQLVFHLAKR